jgi:hypothetical protein
VCYGRRACVRQLWRDNQKPGMGPLVLKALDRQRDEVISISRHDTISHGRQ